MSTPTKRKADGGGMRSAKAKGSSANAALSPQTIEYLRGWMMSPEHIEHPYPDENEKAIIMSDTGITAKQLTCWFSNNRKRFWKPKMEEMGRHAVVQAAMGNTLSPHTIEYLKGWMMHPNHIQNPYPTEEEKTEIMAATGIEKKQLTCWFSNNRKRFWRPKMDKLRADYGLSDTEPLPAALLATAASTTALAPATVVANPPPPTLTNDLINDDILAADILAAVGCQPVVPIETTYALAQAPPLSTLDDHASYGAPAADATAVAATNSTTQLPIETTYAPQAPSVAVTSFSPTMVAQQSMVALGEAPVVTMQPLDASSFITHQQQFGVQEYNPLEGGGVAPVAALPLEGGDGRATLPLEDFSPSFFDQGGASVVDEVKQQQEGQQQPGNKRPKVSMDDGMVAV